MRRLSSVVLAFAGMCTLELTAAASPALALRNLRSQDAGQRRCVPGPYRTCSRRSGRRSLAARAIIPAARRSCRSRCGARCQEVASPIKFADVDRGDALWRPRRSRAAGTTSRRRRASSRSSRRRRFTSNKYDNAAMPFAQFFDPAGIAMHAGFNPGNEPSHGCIRLPSFAKKLYSVTDVGTPVYVGA